MFTRCCLVLFTQPGTGTLNSFQLITVLLELEQKSTSTLLGKSNAWAICHEWLLLMAWYFTLQIARSLHWSMRVWANVQLPIRYCTSLMDRLNFCPWYFLAVQRLFLAFFGWVESGGEWYPRWHQEVRCWQLNQGYKILHLVHSSFLHLLDWNLVSFFFSSTC